MDSWITLKEVCEKYNVSRRAIQGYEKFNLVKPSGKNKMGHLLYDVQAQEKINKIHHFQLYGFQLKEIVEVIDASNDVLKECLLNKLETLEHQKDQLSDVIVDLKNLINSLS